MERKYGKIDAGRVVGPGVPNQYPLAAFTNAFPANIQGSGPPVRARESRCEYCGSFGEKRKCESCGAPAQRSLLPVAHGCSEYSDWRADLARRSKEVYYLEAIGQPVGASPPCETMGSTNPDRYREAIALMEIAGPTGPARGSLTYADIEALEKASSRGMFSEVLRFICFWVLWR